MKKVIVEYETSEGLKVIEFESENDIVPDFFNSEETVICIVEKDEKRYLRELAVISLDSFVSFRVEELKEA